MGNKISGKDFIKIGFPKNNSINIAIGQIHRYRKKKRNKRLLTKQKKFYLSQKNTSVTEFGEKLRKD